MRRKNHKIRRGQRRNFHRKGKKRYKKRNFLNINPYIFNAISFILIGILLFRFSTLIFIQWFSWPEGVFWGYLIGGCFILGGFFSLIAFWRNNVLSAGKHFGIALGKKHKI